MTFLNKDNTLKKTIHKKINAILDKKSNESGFKSVTTVDFFDLNLPDANNIVLGDVVGWVEPIFLGNFRNAKFSHFEFFYGEIIKESYGAKKAQHTFTIKNVNGSTTTKKGRTLFKKVCFLLKSAEQRETLQKEKNERGQKAKIAALENWISENDVSHPRYEEKLIKLQTMKSLY